MDDMKNAVLYVHGKDGSATECEHYRPLFPDCKVFGLDYRTFTPWETGAEIRTEVSMQGGHQMEYKITPMFPFKVIGFQKEFDSETAYAEIPKFWDEICEKYAANVYAGNAPTNPYEQALMDNCIGEYGVCIDDIGGGKFRYLVAGKYTGGDVPEGIQVSFILFQSVRLLPSTL